MTGSSRAATADPLASARVGTLARLFSIRDDSPPYALAEVLAESLSETGATEIVLHLASHDGERLVALVPGERAPHSILNVDESLPGKVYAEQQHVEVEEGVLTRLLMPVTERSYRLGVLEMKVPGLDENLRRQAAEYAILAAHLLLTDGRYTDYYLCTRRIEPMQLPAELQWQLLPPRAMGFGGVSVAGMLVPAYDIGGDLFDYAADPDLIHLAVFDCMGHGILSSVVSGLVAGAYRNSRRNDAGLVARASAVDAALRNFGLDFFATGIIGEVDTTRGELRFVNHAHADPLLLRNGSVQPLGPTSRAIPLGLADGRSAGEEAEVQTVDLEHGDLLVFHSDGAVELRDPDGLPLDDAGFAEVLLRQAKACDEPWEMTRRVAGELMAYRGSDLVDDATIMVLRYAPGD